MTTCQGGCSVSQMFMRGALALVMMVGVVAMPVQAGSSSDNGGPGGRQKPPGFSELDQNGDGKLSSSEVADDRFLSDKFSEFDSDGDGYLTEDEMPGPGNGKGPGGPGGQPPSRD